MAHTVESIEFAIVHTDLAMALITTLSTRRNIVTKESHTSRGRWTPGEQRSNTTL